MTPADHHPHRMRFTPFLPLPDDKLCEGTGGRLWLDALSPRTKGPVKGPLGRARTYARTATVTHLVIEPGTIRCWINENTTTDPTPGAYTPQPNPTIRIPVLDHGQWRDLTVISRHLADRLARLPAGDVLEEITSTGARNNIRLLPGLDQCLTSCSCSSRSALCKHAATALLQAARCFDTMPLVLLLLRGRAPSDFFSGLRDSDHPSLHHGATSLPLPRVTPAQSAYHQWEHAPRPPLPALPAPPHQTGPPPTPPAVSGLDAQALAGYVTDTTQRAHALLLTLTQPGTPAAPPPTGGPAQEGTDDRQPASHPLPHIPLQQRIREFQKATGMTGAELAQAIHDLDVNG